MSLAPRAWRRGCVGLAGALAAGAACLAADTCTLSNPKKSECANELVRLTLPAPGPAGTFVVSEDGKEAAYQVEELAGKNWVWICSTFAGGATKTYAVSAGQPAAFPPRVIIIRDGDTYLLDNGILAVKVPAEARDGIPGPLAGLHMPDGAWIGGSLWATRLPLRKFTATQVGDGTLFAKVRLRYDFDGPSESDAALPAYAEVTVALGPEWRHVEITERHAMSRDDNWVFELSRGWAPTDGLAKNFDGGLGRPLPEPNRPLKPVVHQSFAPDMYLNLVPRWNQNYRDGWAFCATDGKQQAGAMAVRASRWDWPHSNAIVAVVKPSGDYAGLRCPTFCGARLWWLVNGPEPVDARYVARHAWEHLDKLNHEMILDWPGKKGSYSGVNFYDNVNINPTSMIRGWNRRAEADAGKPGDYGTLALQQTLMHSDSYGSYWQYFSPENPNFFSDFYSRAIFLVSNLKEHPRYEDLKRQAVLRAREDIYHSVTLPGGAGQECPGYMSIGHWSRFANILKTHLGVDDPVLNERLEAALSFRRRISQPDWPVRRRLPIGDTHNGRDPDGKPGPAIETVPEEEVRAWTAAELPGFGVIFNAQPGTERESYLSFKSGPNRGHYHGDQLAFHYGAAAHPVAVDHHCSYHPRASTEHMHNRVAFFTGEFPYANMDGFERLIAFKSLPEAAAAMGQVESPRLRQMEAFPPSRWHPEFPQHVFAEPLVYRRTVVLMRSPETDYFVIRDQFWASEPIHAAFCLHALDPNVVCGLTREPVKDGNVLTDAAQDFKRLEVLPGSTVAILDCQEDRTAKKMVDGSVFFSASVKAVTPTTLTVETPLPAAGIRSDAHVAQGERAVPGAPLSYRVFRPVQQPTPGLFRFNGGLRLYCQASGNFTAEAFPWEHNNGGRESTQGLRLVLRGVRSGQFISVLFHGTDLDVAPVAGGVRVGKDEILFAGDTPAAGDDTRQVVARRDGKELLVLTGRDVDLNRSQGDVGLCVQDAGHVFGPLPDWLRQQRARRPAWYEALKDPWTR